MMFAEKSVFLVLRKCDVWILLYGYDLELFFALGCYVSVTFEIRDFTRGAIRASFGYQQQEQLPTIEAMTT